MADEPTGGASGAPDTQPADTAPAQDAASVQRANGEAARFRSERNDALRRAHAFATILKAHNIGTDGVTPDALAGLQIEGGAVKGEFPYTPPKPNLNGAQAASGGRPPATAPAITREALARMTAGQIARLDWEREVAPVLRGA